MWTGTKSTPILKRHATTSKSGNDDSRVMNAHGYVSLVEMTPDENGKYVVARELGDKQW